MTKKLRKRFIVFTMLAVSLLLVFLVIAINGLNGMMLQRQSDAVLDMLVQSDGVFHKMDFNRPPPFSAPMDMDRMRAARFFTVLGDENGNILNVNTDQISNIDPETAEEYGALVLEGKNETGRINSYQFAVKELGQNRLVFFVDTSLQRENFRIVLTVSGLIAVLCWVVILLLVVLLSSRVIRPVVAAMEKQKQFITNAGHEMKTPLAIIQSNNDTMSLLHGENKYNAHIRTQTKRLDGLMANMLTLAKLDEEVPLKREPIPIGLVLKELLAPYADAAESRDIAMCVQMDDDLTISTNGDSFGQLLTIIMDNAVKYTPVGGSILFSASKHGRRLKIVEENTCSFLPGSDPERLFERFYRGDTARTQQDNTSGYGIGLSAARAICENLGGSLRAVYIGEDRIRFTAEL